MLVHFKTPYISFTWQVDYGGGLHYWGILLYAHSLLEFAHKNDGKTRAKHNTCTVLYKYLCIQYSGASVLYMCDFFGQIIQYATFSFSTCKQYMY